MKLFPYENREFSSEQYTCLSIISKKFSHALREEEPN